MANHARRMAPFCGRSCPGRHHTALRLDRTEVRRPYIGVPRLSFDMPGGWRQSDCGSPSFLGQDNRVELLAHRYGCAPLFCCCLFGRLGGGAAKKRRERYGYLLNLTTRSCTDQTPRLACWSDFYALTHTAKVGSIFSREREQLCRRSATARKGDGCCIGRSTVEISRILIGGSTSRSLLQCDERRICPRCCHQRHNSHRRCFPRLGDGTGKDRRDSRAYTAS